ncbi:MAG: ecdysteroid 22-kinase family protein [Gammaproteobacteria bacterium]|nr:ecdysteroid 22-kinase family protein [Gammaproteobacteria bacterium]
MSRAVTAVQLAALAARGGARVLRDILGDVPGWSMPYRAQLVAQPQQLSRMINAAALPACQGPVNIRTVTVQDVPSVSSNCHNLVLSLEQVGAPMLPHSVFVKLPMESLATHWFFSVINSWRLESHFFRHVAPHVPLQTPVTYATAWQGSRFFLVQENLNANDQVTLFTNPDMLQGPSQNQVALCLDAFARLHAKHVHLSPAEREAILPLEYHLFLSPSMGLASRSLNALALSPCMKKRPGRIPAEVAAAYEQSIEHWDVLLEHWFSGPLSLLHGDSHLGNFYQIGDEMGMLDWQAAHWGKGIRDVQYFLIDAMPASELAAQERDWVDYYVQRRAVHGAPLEREAAWQDYRSLTFHTLFTIVVSIGFGALNEEQDALMTELLERAVAATQRVDYAGWLRDYLASHPNI